MAIVALWCSYGWWVLRERENGEDKRARWWVLRERMEKTRQERSMADNF
jgi:hypothetical protein